MESKNFSSPDATEKSREVRLNQLRERRSKSANNGAAINGAAINGAAINGAVIKRSPEPIIDNRFDNRLEFRGTESKVKPLPSRQGANRQERLASTPNQPVELRPTNLKTRRKPNISNNRPIAAKSSAKSFGWQVLRLAIAGIGLSVIAGTAISFWQNQQSNRAKPLTAEVVAKEESSKSSQDIAPLSLKTEATPLATKIKELAATEKDLNMQMMVVELDSGAYMQVSSNQAIAAASTIKTPILVAFFQDVDAGKIKLDEQLEMSADVRVGQAGEFQYLPLGTKISALETATKMIVISDNTATNMIIKRLGGNVALNQRFKSWGMNNTVINNPLPDLEGTNTISTQDLVSLMAMIDLGKLVEPRSRDRFMDIMRRPVTNTLLPQGIGEEARIIHKTGDIASSVGDAGIVDMPNGRRYAIAVMVKRPDNDQRANELIRQISRATYEYFRTGGSLPSNNSSINSTPPINSADTNNPANNLANPNNRGTNTIENIPLPSPNVSPNASPNTLPNSTELTRQNR